MITKYPLEKIVVNTSFGKLTQMGEFEAKMLPEIEKEFAQVVGQKGQYRKAKKSVAGFKLRQGQVIGLKVTLRRKRMMQFLERVVNIVLPRIRDFRGLNLHSIDDGGNLTFGIKEHIVFPEIIAEESKVNFGIEITLVPKNKLDRQEAVALYRKLGVPLEKEAKTQ